MRVIRSRRAGKSQVSKNFFFKKKKQKTFDSFRRKIKQKFFASFF